MLYALYALFVGWAAAVAWFAGRAMAELICGDFVRSTEKLAKACEEMNKPYDRFRQ